ncbi:uncharacterized protein LOC141580899 [Saimiri boliviensis]|uniref:uncharacterized protein LOC141580899 n=1 Tax=Saimiri boliviensis TaxID=27679 RepID=UPI003D787A96
MGLGAVGPRRGAEGLGVETRGPTPTPARLRRRKLSGLQPDRDSRGVRCPRGFRFRHLQLPRYEAESLLPWETGGPAAPSGPRRTPCQASWGWHLGCAGEGVAGAEPGAGSEQPGVWGRILVVNLARVAYFHVNDVYLHAVLSHVRFFQGSLFASEAWQIKITRPLPRGLRDWELGQRGGAAGLSPAGPRLLSGFRVSLFLPSDYITLLEDMFAILIKEMRPQLSENPGQTHFGTSTIRSSPAPKEARRPEVRSPRPQSAQNASL